jgi:hypothetical protein
MVKGDPAKRGAKSTTPLQPLIDGKRTKLDAVAGGRTLLFSCHLSREPSSMVGLELSWLSTASITVEVSQDRHHETIPWVAKNKEQSGGKERKQDETLVILPADPSLRAGGLFYVRIVDVQGPLQIVASARKFGHLASTPNVPEAHIDKLESEFARLNNDFSLNHEKQENLRNTSRLRQEKKPSKTAQLFISKSPRKAVASRDTRDHQIKGKHKAKRPIQQRKMGFGCKFSFPDEAKAEQQKYENKQVSKTALQLNTAQSRSAKTDQYVQDTLMPYPPKERRDYEDQPINFDQMLRRAPAQKNRRYGVFNPGGGAAAPKKPSVYISTPYKEPTDEVRNFERVVIVPPAGAANGAKKNTRAQKVGYRKRERSRGGAAVADKMGCAPDHEEPKPRVSQWGARFQETMDREVKLLATAGAEAPIEEIGGLLLETPVPRKHHNRPPQKFRDPLLKFLGEDYEPVQAKEKAVELPRVAAGRRGVVDVSFAGITENQRFVDRLTVTSGF